MNESGDDVATRPPKGISSWLPSIWRRIHTPVYALAIDLFRILAALLVGSYFLDTLLEFDDFSSDFGLLDHALIRELFWFTELSVLSEGTPPAVRLLLLGLGMVAAAAILIGWHPKLFAGIAWLVAISFQRWNFLVVNIDDSSITLLLWWLMFLPIGHTLTFRDLLARRRLAELSKVEVDGFFLRAFFANLFIYYLTAGLSKLLSPLWREGLALYVILKLPLSRSHEFWDLGHLPLLWLGNHLTLLFEPLLPFLVLASRGRGLKVLGTMVSLGLHFGIVLSIGVPYANLTLLICLVLAFHREIPRLFQAGENGDQNFQDLRRDPPIRGARALICGYLLVLLMTATKGIPWLEKTHEPAMAVLYLGGIAQEYHLFDWIDRYNWSVEHEVTVQPEEGQVKQVDSALLYPKSVRGFIAQSYLLPIRWMRIQRPRIGEMRNSLHRRSAERLLRQLAPPDTEQGVITVTSTVGRLERDNLSLDETRTFRSLQFTYRGSSLLSVDFPRPPVAGLKKAHKSP